MFKLDESHDNVRHVRETTMTDFLRNIFKTRVRLADDVIDKFVDDHAIKVYEESLTSPTCNPAHNYELYEKVGDRIGNHAILNYILERFPILSSYSRFSIKFLTRIENNLKSKKQLAELGDMLGLGPYIIANASLSKIEAVYEDCFEAFLGATLLIANRKFARGLGERITYEIISSLLDEVNIGIRYIDLYDPITILKEEIEDGSKLKLKYNTKETKSDNDEHSVIHTCTLKVTDPTTKKIVCKKSATSSKKPESRQFAARKVLDELVNIGGYIKYDLETNFDDIIRSETVITKDTPIFAMQDTFRTKEECSYQKFLQEKYE